MRNLTNIQQLKRKIGPTSAFDYQTVMVPMVKSFLRVCIYFICQHVLRLIFWTFSSADWFLFDSLSWKL